MKIKRIIEVSPGEFFLVSLSTLALSFLADRYRPGLSSVIVLAYCIYGMSILNYRYFQLKKELRRHRP